MMATPRRRRVSAERRRVLQLLASSQNGITEVLLFAHGVTHHMLDRLIRSGLATIQRETFKAGDGTIELAASPSRTPAGGHSKADRTRPGTVPPRPALAYCVWLSDMASRGPGPLICFLPHEGRGLRGESPCPSGSSPTARPARSR